MQFIAGSDKSNVKSFIINKMYKLQSKVYLIFKIVKSVIQWSKRKVILIIAAFMIGMSNVIMEEDKMVDNSQTQTEQQHREHEDNHTE